MRSDKTNNKQISQDAKEQVEKVIRQLNSSTSNEPSKRTSPIRSNNSSVLGKSNKPVNIK
ncbi:hypothetical protein [Lysinibacillus sp. FSL K6-4013]|uniref:hypothetical protein n=1 Tax=Lysinibacillus sp. FSL K6-4013 TaxID=2921504 RepID=UPI003159C8A9